MDEFNRAVAERPLATILVMLIISTCLAIVTQAAEAKAAVDSTQQMERR